MIDSLHNSTGKLTTTKVYWLDGWRFGLRDAAYMHGVICLAFGTSPLDLNRELANFGDLHRRLAVSVTLVLPWGISRYCILRDCKSSAIRQDENMATFITVTCHCGTQGFCNTTVPGPWAWEGVCVSLASKSKAEYSFRCRLEFLVGPAKEALPWPCSHNKLSCIVLAGVTWETNTKKETKTNNWQALETNLRQLWQQRYP